MAQTANSTANVSTTRGVKGGYMFSAVRTTETIAALQTLLDASGLAKITTPIPDSIPNMGYLSGDGFNEGLDRSSDSLSDINGDTVDTYGSTSTETLGVTLMETAAKPLGLYYGSQNVSDASGLLTVDHNWSNSDEERIVILDLVLKNGRRWRKVIPICKVTERGEFTGNSTTAAQRNLTLTYQTDQNGSGCLDWFQSTETSASTGTGN